MTRPIFGLIRQFCISFYLKFWKIGKNKNISLLRLLSKIHLLIQLLVMPFVEIQFSHVYNVVFWTDWSFTNFFSEYFNFKQYLLNFSRKRKIFHILKFLILVWFLKSFLPHLLSFQSKAFTLNLAKKSFKS